MTNIITQEMEKIEAKVSEEWRKICGRKVNEMMRASY